MRRLITILLAPGLPVAALIPAGRIGVSADVAGAILFLAGDAAAVDGGLSLMGMRP